MAALRLPTSPSAAPPLLRAAGRRLLGRQHAARVLFAVLQARPRPAPVAHASPVTDLLHARLAPGDREATVAAMAGSAAELHAAADEATRRRLELNHIAAFGPGPARERLGLLAAMPPDDVHAMARDWTAIGGDTHLVDLVVAAFEAAGLPLSDGASVLDFGCSSGRLLRILAAARPDLRCAGVDPNAAAIAWAAAHLPGTWAVSPLAPPLDLPDASLDAVVALSIWTHFAARPAELWLEEMARVVRPGGALLLTTHSWDALLAFERREMIDRYVVGTAAAALMTGGHHFVSVFGPGGDWGVSDPGWGDAYCTTEWLAARTGAAWAIELLWPAAVEGAQDLFVLRRR